MKLDKFVSETIKQVIQGVDSAQKYSNQHRAKVNPVTARFNSKTEGQTYCVQTGVPLQKIKFDVAVTVTKEQVSSNNGGSIGSISVSSESSNNSHNSSISRIQFEVPILLPMYEIPD